MARNLELSDIAGRNVKQYKHFEREFVKLTLEQHGSGTAHIHLYMDFFLINTVLYMHFLFLILTFSLVLL